MLVALVDVLQQVLPYNVVELLGGVVAELFGDVGTLHCFVQESGPVEAFEEGVLLDLVESGGAALFGLFY